MSIYKYNSIRYNGGIDISNTLNISREINTEANAPVRREAAENAQPKQSETVPEVPEITAEELLEQREEELKAAAAELEQRKKELADLREQYIEQGKQVIVEAKRRAEGIINNANADADSIVSDAEKKRDDVFIKARAEGFEQGKKDGAALVLKESQTVIDEVRDYSDKINAGKAELFEKYEKEIYETVMQIANKVTMNSMSVKDGTAAKKLIKAAAKEFRNSQLIRITLDANDASTELSGDYEYLKGLCGGMAHVEIELIADAEPGTIIIDNGEEITDAGIMTQLNMIKALGDGKFRGETQKKRSTRRKKTADSEEQAAAPDEKAEQNDK